MGPPSQVETSSGRGARRDSQVVIQRNPYGVWVLGRGARSKNKRQSPPASPSGSSINVPATRLERRTEAAQSIRTRDNVAHSWVNHHQLLLGNWNITHPHRKRARIGWGSKAVSSRYYRSFFNQTTCSGTVDLDGWIRNILVLILVCLHKRVCGILTSPPFVRLCVRLDSCGITGLYVEAQGIGSVIVSIAGICLQCHEWISGFCGWRKRCSSTSISYWIYSPYGGFQRTCWNRHRYVEGCDRKTWSHWTEWERKVFIAALLQQRTPHHEYLFPAHKR